MKKIYSTLIIALITIFNLQAQDWAWIQGGSTRNNYSIYEGTKPGAREGFVSWTDATGNLWLFGGFGYDNSSLGRLNDLWKYNPTTNEWIWMKGSSIIDQLGVYGTQGTSGVNNIPGARSGSVSWTDASGNLWLFGGDGYGSSGFGRLNDLWKYNPTTNEWTWVKGSNTGNQTAVFGTQGLSSTANTPGAREKPVSWTDASGNMWLFGGFGLASTATPGWLSDLWKYNPTTNEWTWVKGSNTIDQTGAYGIQGISGVANTPGARNSAVSWTDASGNMWIFGGFGKGSSSTTGDLNDLWQYNPTANQWTWMKGSSIIDQLGAYGTLGTSGVNNAPGARSGSVSWTDASGNLWLFGGKGYDGVSSSTGNLNDLWKYDMTINQWTWMKGANTKNQIGAYGTLGTSGLSNTPGARGLSVSWTDPSGNLWMFGGYGNGFFSGVGSLSDLWKYNPITDEWSWIKGSNTINRLGIYGTQGTSLVKNTPGARNASVSWKDSSGNLWLFGGFGYTDSGFSGYLNDLWKYDPTTNEWTWMKGTSILNQFGVYGTQGTSGVNNTPGAREGSVSWTDASGNLWLFGGVGYASSGSMGYLNDLWKYDPTTNQWTWVKGGNLTDLIGSYGQLGISNSTNLPSGRSNSTGCVDSNGDFWLLNGEGYTTLSISGRLNDVWKYNLSNNEWTWMKGASTINQNGSYGTQGIMSTNNTPGARTNSVCWSGNSGLWLFGGFGNVASGPIGHLNDLWKYEMVVCTAPSAPVNVTSLSNQNKCNGNNTNIDVTGAGTINWYASPSSTNIIGSGNTFSVTNLTTGTYTYYAEATTCTVSPSRTAITITVSPSPTVTVISSNSLMCLGQTAILTVSGANTYSWNTGANTTSISVTPTTNITYTVTGIDANGCANTSTITQNVSVCTGINDVSNAKGNMNIYPNPNKGIFTVDTEREISIIITNVLGEVILSQNVLRGVNLINISSYANGMYLFNCEGSVIKIIKQ